MYRSPTASVSASGRTPAEAVGSDKLAAAAQTVPANELAANEQRKARLRPCH